ncbi:MAG TPA: metallophosphoesterase, partial [Kofleriaceae bacterium]|nr:metallophosphoesterase [Kofleriaceae bacterium]
GSNSRLMDIIEALDRVIEAGVKRKATALIHCGDLFHDRKGVKPEAIHRATEWLAKARDAFSDGVHILTGNHDMSIGGDGTASTAAAEGLATVYHVPTVSTIAGEKPSNGNGAQKMGPVNGVSHAWRSAVDKL